MKQNIPPSTHSQLPEPLPYNAQTDSPFTVFLARRGMTIKDFAAKAGLNYHHLFHTLSGRYPNTRMSSVCKMARVAGLRPDQMFEYIRYEVEWRNEQRQKKQAKKADDFIR